MTLFDRITEIEDEIEFHQQEAERLRFELVRVKDASKDVCSKCHGTGRALPTETTHDDPWFYPCTKCWGTMNNPPKKAKAQ